MKVTNTWPHEAMGEELEMLLVRLRADYPDTQDWIERKVSVMTQYMRDCNRDTIVVAVSGGIDSAVAYGLSALLLKRGIIKRLVGVSLPVYSSAATNQEAAASRGSAVVDVFGGEFYEVPLAPSLDVLAGALEAALPVEDEWARGQLASYVRTPAIYYTTSLLTAQGYRPVVMGTTNRDEGAYIGYFGKASDGMVDVQILSDMPKSRVRAVAKALGVPDTVLRVAPSGDMYDGRLDEQVFGAPYDFVELDTECRLRKDAPVAQLSVDARQIFDDFRGNIENMHRYNGHKYLGASPAVHLDVVNARFVGGWSYRVYEGLTDACLDPTAGDHRRW